MNPEHIQAQCQRWVSEFIVAKGICPFAAPVVAQEQLAYEVITGRDGEALLMAAMDRVLHMCSEETPETMLLIVPGLVDDFDSFLELLDILNALLREQNLLDILQIASFHPHYLFAEEPDDDASHYTNRAPWPIWHLIRQQSVSRAIAKYPHPEQIPVRNITLMQQLGREFLAQQLTDWRS